MCVRQTFGFLSATLQRAIQSGVLKMADSSTRDAVIRRELGVPPTFDLVRHARNLARVFFPALVIALLVGGIVYAVRGSATPVYQSDIVAEVQSALSDRRDGREPRPVGLPPMSHWPPIAMWLPPSTTS